MSLSDAVSCQPVHAVGWLLCLGDPGELDSRLSKPINEDIKLFSFRWKFCAFRERIPGKAGNIYQAPAMCQTLF